MVTTAVYHIDLREMAVKVLNLSMIAITLKKTITDHLFLQDHSTLTRTMLIRISSISYISSALSRLCLLDSHYRSSTETQIR